MSSNPFIDNLPSPGREMAQLIAKKNDFLGADEQTTMIRLANSNLLLLGYLVSGTEPGDLEKGARNLFISLSLVDQQVGTGYTQIRLALKAAVTSGFNNLSGYKWIMDDE